MVMARSNAVRGVIAIGLTLAVLGPNAPATGQGVAVSGLLQQTFVAQFDGEDPAQRVTISGFNRTTAFAQEFVPETPVQGQDAVSQGCVEFRRGTRLTLRDRACGEFTMYADPTLSSGVFVGQLPTEGEATVTVVVVFTSTEPPAPPAPFVNPPPFFNANGSISRVATAVGMISTDAGEGFSEPVTSTFAGMGETFTVQANVFP